MRENFVILYFSILIQIFCGKKKPSRSEYSVWIPYKNTSCSTVLLPFLRPPPTSLTPLPQLILLTPRKSNINPSMQRTRIWPARARSYCTKGSNINSRVGGNHFGQNINNRFRHSLIVYLNQIAGLRVDFESFVEA